MEVTPSPMVTFADGDVRQVAATIERRSPDESDAIRDHNARQAGATLERRSPDGSDAVTDRHTRQAAATRERPIPDRRYAPRDRDTIQWIITRKCQAINTIRSVGYDDVRLRFSVVIEDNTIIPQRVCIFRRKIDAAPRTEVLNLNTL